MDTMNDGASADMPAQDRALAALADLMEDLGGEASYAFVGRQPEDDERLANCTARAEAVVRAIVALPAVTLRGASAKARAVRAHYATALLPRDLVDALASDMHADVTRLRAPTEVAGHA